MQFGAARLKSERANQWARPIHCLTSSVARSWSTTKPIANVGVGRFFDGGRWITDGEAQYGQIVASMPDRPVNAAPHD
ncbi:hypothetical protein RBSWK_05377 [Rhodopirellula baltica SWK14]|uniref:Uncharacterized protein n=1 Tax=Rhodopirellula baltica SWK14 TaxID=993516 RepID=L7C9D3_RHOBT|nr:hypothetical protein RBSWK_05377 [Rhodopirellula baltica SWK14]